MKQNALCLDGREYTPDTLEQLRGEDGLPLLELKSFLEAWFSDSPTMPVQTSGSTGRPKAFAVEKHRMEASARMTCAFLGLQPGDTALLCMPLKYIGGKMVVVRSLVAGLNLHCVTPSSHPFRGLSRSPDFAALTPAQLFTTLEVAEETALLRGVRHLLVGGSAVDESLRKRIDDFPHCIWSTYGMTETLSHIALRRLNGPDASEWYAPLPGVSVHLSAEGTLCIDAPAVCAARLVTNDIAELDDAGHFRILGRKDNTINSGGIKIQIETLETALALHMDSPFCITSAPDPHFGEIVVMLVQGEDSVEKSMELCRKVLHPYSRPRRILQVESLPRTGSGKPDRATARRMAHDRLTPRP